MKSSKKPLSLSLLLASLLATSIVGCNSGGATNNSAPKSNVQNASQTSESQNGGAESSNKQVGNLGKAVNSQNLKSVDHGTTIIHLVNKTNRILPIKMVDSQYIGCGGHLCSVAIPKSIAQGQEATWEFSPVFDPRFPFVVDPTVAITLDGVPSISISNDPHAYDDLYRGGSTAKAFGHDYGSNDYILRTSNLKGLDFKITNIPNSKDDTTENIIEVTDKPTYDRDEFSVPGSRLCAVATHDCPSTMTMKTNSMIVSDHGTYAAVMQADGNFVIYSHSRGVARSIPIWASNTDGKGVKYLALGGDGNFGLYRENGTPVWTANTDGKGATYLQLGDDGNFGLYKENGTPVWTTNTIWK